MQWLEHYVPSTIEWLDPLPIPVQSLYNIDIKFTVT
jgi:hypothetical protein